MMDRDMARGVFIKLLVLFSAALAMGHKPHEHLRHWETASPDPDRIFLSFYIALWSHELKTPEIFVL